MKLHVRVYHGTLWHFESKFHPNHVCVLHHRAQSVICTLMTSAVDKSGSWRITWIRRKQ